MNDELDNLSKRTTQNAENTVKLAEAIGRMIALIERIDNRLEDVSQRLVQVEHKLNLPGPNPEQGNSGGESAPESRKDDGE